MARPTDPRRSPLLTMYRAATALADPLAGPILSWRTRRGKEDPRRRSERYGIATIARPDGPLVWVHAASVGETVSVLPLIDAVIARHPVSVLLTTGTLTSARLADARLGEHAVHQFVPLDARRFVRRFLQHWRPGLAVFVESELWPNMILQTEAFGASLALVNARMSDRSFRRWHRRAPGMAQTLLGRFDMCLAQSERDAGRLVELGAEPVYWTGNLKYDVPAPRASAVELGRLKAVIRDRPRWAAASIHPGEDESVLDAERLLRERRPGMLAIVAPRHPERGSDIVAAAAARGLSAVLRSSGGLPGPEIDVYVVDTIGEMGLVYALAPVAFMGGSLVRHGGQNPIEPAKLSTAILHGPHIGNFAEVYAALQDAGGAELVTSAIDLAGKVQRLIETPASAELRADAARRAVAAFAGALDRVVQALDPLIAPMAQE